MSFNNPSISRMAKTVIERHIKMLKEFDNDTKSISSVSTSKSSSQRDTYHSFIKNETLKINEELLNSKETKTKMEIRKIAIERWNIYKTKTLKSK